MSRADVLLVVVLAVVFVFAIVFYFSGPAAISKNEDFENHIAPRQATGKYAIVTFFCGQPSNFYNAASMNKQIYAERHGYDLIDLSEEGKILYACQQDKYTKALYRYTAISHVLPYYDGVLWTSPHSLFLNHSRSLDELLDPKYDLHLTVGPPTSRFWKKFGNDGTFFVRNTPYGRAFIAEIDQLSSQKCHPIRNGEQEIDKISNQRICKQDKWAFADVGMSVVIINNHTDPSWLCHLRFLPFRAFNSEFPWYQNGDLVLNLPFRDSDELHLQILSATDFENGVVDFDAEPSLKPVKDGDLNDLTDLFEIIKLYDDTWNSPCSQSLDATNEIVDLFL